MSENYKSKVIYTSRETSFKEKTMLKDFTECIQLVDALEQGAVLIDVDFYADVEVHNEKSDNKDYTKRVIVDKSGVKYVTGSDTFMRAMDDIVDGMEESGEEWKLKVLERDSNNYKGKKFITCVIV